MKVFVTGIDGFLGLRLSRQLERSGHRVGGLVLDRAVAAERDLSPSVELFVGDLLDVRRLRGAIDQFEPEAVVHLAGLSHVGRSWSAIPRYFQINVLGTRRLLDAIAEAQTVGPVIFASSSEVYGQVENEDLPVTEDVLPAPSSPYALAKAATELLVLERGGTVTRMFNLVGPGQSADFALPSFAHQLAAIRRGEGDARIAVGNLSVRRDFVHVDDAAEALELLLDRGRSGEIYNLATGVVVELRAALDLLIEVAGVEARVEHDPDRDRPVDVPVMVGDAGRLRALGWRPRRDLRRALEDLWRSVG